MKITFIEYCKCFLAALIGSILAAGAPLIATWGLSYTFIPVWGTIIITSILIFVSLFVTCKWINWATDRILMKRKDKRK